MRKYLNYGRYLMFFIFFIALSLPVSCFGETVETSTGGNDIAVETKTLLDENNVDSLLKDLARREKRDAEINHFRPRRGIIEYQTESIPVTGDALQTNSLSVTRAAYGSGMLGSGTESDPYQVATAEDLDNVRNDLTAYYIQVADIDLSEYENWVPIGYYTYEYDHVFNGSYDGNGFTISNLTINSPGEQDLGLFGLIETNLPIIRIKLINVNITGDRYIGALAGDACCDLIDCSASGGTLHYTWAGIWSSGYDFGGLVGIFYTGYPHENPIISGCSADIDIDGGEDPDVFAGYAGGLIGCVIVNDGHTLSISKCFATGDVVCPDYVTDNDYYESWKCGGLIGSVEWGSPSIENCYARGNVVCPCFGGGLIGYTEYYYSESGGEDQSIVNCYSTGEVKIPPGYIEGFHYTNYDDPGWSLGGLLGYRGEYNVVTSCYYDTETSTQSDNDGHGVPKTTAQMKTQSTYVDWDFENIWVLGSPNDGYPYLGTCLPDKTTLGIRPYCLYGNGSINLSTGNFILEQTDLALPSIGPSLEFTRFYNSTDTYEGPQGKGWTHNYNTHLNINPDQSINVAYPDGQELKFTYNGSGYDRPAGCFETLQAGPDSTYILTFKDQTKCIYNSAGQLTSITDKNSNTLTLSYINGLLTTAAEPGGRSFAFGYNEDSLLSTVTDSAGRSVGYTYNNGQLETVEDVRDYIIQYQYNEQGLTTINDPDNITLLHNDYDSCSRVISQTDGRGNVTGFNFTQANQTTVTDAVYKTTIVDYDDKYRSTDVAYPGNITQSFAYDDNNCCQEITDGRGNKTYYNYDDFGNLLKITDPAGNETVMTYTGCNNLDTVTNAVYSEIDFGYDAAGNLINMEDPFGETTTYDYYSNGLLQSITTPDGTDIGSGITVCAYYQDGLLHTVTDAVYNTTTTYGYDDYGFLHTITDAANKTTTINHDAAGNITGVTDPLGNTVGFTYDWRGNVLTKTDARDNLTQYFYNEAGQLSRVLDALDNETLYAYNELNQLETVTDPRGYQTTYSYDDLGRLSGITDPLGHTTSYHYDNAGNLDEITDAYGKQVLGAEYDNRNNPVAVADALGNTTTNTFTALNSLDTSKDPMDNITNLDYDNLNRLNYTTDATTTGHGSQTFDAHGNRNTMTDPNTNTTAFRLDPSNRVKKITTAAGGEIDIEYNSRDLISWKKNARGQETTYSYYDNGLLHYFTSPDGTTTYTYDENGSLLTATDSNGTIEYRYDELNRVKEYIDASGNLIGYTYDENSNLKTITYPGGKQVLYDYNAANQLETVTDWEERITSYEYDFNGRLTKTTRPDGTVETRDYYDNGKLKQLKDVDANENIISRYDYTYDAAGNITDDNNSNEAGTYTFNSAALTYDAGNRLGTYNGQTVNYDADGNMTRGPLAGDMENFTFDARSRLTGAGDTSYTYDAGNKRIRVSEGVHQTSYAVNPNAPLSQVLTATDEQNNKTYYVYGLGLISQESAGGDYSSYHFDHLGSTVALTNETGSVTDRFQYTPYGELIYRSGSTATPFLFNGQYGVMADASDLYYMRARYYNPVAKRFLSPDTLIGNISNSQSQNRYIYCEGNPANYIDPTGYATDYEIQNQAILDARSMIDKTMYRLKNHWKAGGNYFLWEDSHAYMDYEGLCMEAKNYINGENYIQIGLGITRFVDSYIAVSKYEPIPNPYNIYAASVITTGKYYDYKPGMSCFSTPFEYFKDAHKKNKGFTIALAKFNYVMSSDYRYLMLSDYGSYALCKELESLYNNIQQWEYSIFETSEDNAKYKNYMLEYIDNIYDININFEYHIDYVHNIFDQIENAVTDDLAEYINKQISP